MMNCRVCPILCRCADWNNQYGLTYPMDCPDPQHLPYAIEQVKSWKAKQK